MYLVYCITCVSNNKKYIGLTSKSIAARWKQHLTNALTRGQSNLLYRAIRKYGESAFVISTVATEPNKESAIASEKRFIAEYNTNAFKSGSCGYNMTDGGEGTTGRTLTSEQRDHLSNIRKISGIAKGRKNPMYGRGNQLKGSRNPFFGKSHSLETKKKISNSKKGKPNQKIEINQELANKLAALYKFGLSSSSIASILNDEGVSVPRGTHTWTGSGIWAILKRKGLLC